MVKQARSLLKVELEDMIHLVPGYVSTSYYNLYFQKKRIPRFDSVFKIVKEEMQKEGYDYNKLSQKDKIAMQDMARDTYDGIREAES